MGARFLACLPSKHMTIPADQSTVLGHALTLRSSGSKGHRIQPEYEVDDLL
jgi:hypothetical protein